MTSPAPPIVFISYARSDLARADALALSLETAGYCCFVDRHSIVGGQEWVDVIGRALAESVTVVALITAQSVERDWVRAEWATARLLNKSVVPVRVDGSSVPGMLSQFHALSFPGTAGELQPLIQAIEHARGRAVASVGRSATQVNYLHRLQLEVVLHHRLYTPLAGEVQLGTVRHGPAEPLIVQMHPEFALLRHRREGLKGKVERYTFDDASKAFAAVTQAAVLGEPGEGKTTTLFKIAADLLPAALADPAAPLPLLARLGLWVEEHDTLAAFLARHIGCGEPELRWLLEANSVVLLLDGLNELPVIQRARKVQQIRELLVRHPRQRALVSCRSLDYTATDLQLDTLTILPLDAPRVRQFLLAYLDAELESHIADSAERKAQAEAKAERLFWDLAGGTKIQEVWKVWEHAGADLVLFFSATEIPNKRPDVLSILNWRQSALWRKKVLDPRALMRAAYNPYMLAMLIRVYADEGTLPENRARLFGSFVGTLLVREHLATFSAVGVELFEDGTKLLTCLCNLAWAMQTHQAENEAATPSTAATSVSRQQAEQYLLGELLRKAVGASLLNVGAEVRFTHQILQEYFAALGLRKRIEAGDLEATDLWPPERWREPTGWEETALLAARLDEDSPTLVIDWLADASPETAARCARAVGATLPHKTLLNLRRRWVPRLTDIARDPEHASRAAIGRALGSVVLDNGEMLDDRRGVGLRSDGVPDIDWVPIPAGWVSMEESEGRFSVEKFDIARYPVTNRQFQAFVEAVDGYMNAQWWENLERSDQPRPPRWPEANNPRENVSWYEAVAFCRWLSSRLHLPRGSEIRLPTEWEWQQAATGGDPYWLYPWRGDWDPARCNRGESEPNRTTAVGIYPNGASEQGVFDLVGNVWEWCLNKYVEPQNHVALKIDASGNWRALRGGSWNFDQFHCNVFARVDYLPDSHEDDIGLRVVRAPSIGD